MSAPYLHVRSTASVVATFERRLKAVEAAIDALGQLREAGDDLDCQPAALLDARRALWRAHYDLLDHAPTVSVREFIEHHGSPT